LTVRSERAMQRKFQGANWPGNERARERVGQGAKRLGTLEYTAPSSGIDTRDARLV